MPSSRAFKRADTLLEEHGLGKVKRKKIKTLSKGMAQKVQVLAAIAHEPDLIIFDEPFSGLDPVNQRALEEMIRAQAAAGKTVIFSTHVMEHAERLCDRIVLIARGQARSKARCGSVGAGAKRCVARNRRRLRSASGARRERLLHHAGRRGARQPPLARAPQRPGHNAQASCGVRRSASAAVAVRARARELARSVRRRSSATRRRRRMSPIYLVARRDYLAYVGAWGFWVSLIAAPRDHGGAAVRPGAAGARRTARACSLSSPSAPRMQRWCSDFFNRAARQDARAEIRAYLGAAAPAVQGEALDAFDAAPDRAAAIAAARAVLSQNMPRTRCAPSRISAPRYLIAPPPAAHDRWHEAVSQRRAHSRCGGRATALLRRAQYAPHRRRPGHRLLEHVALASRARSTSPSARCVLLCVARRWRRKG